MTLRLTRIHLALAAAAVTLAVPAAASAHADPPAPSLEQAAGTSPASIQCAVDAYRAELGSLNPNMPGSFGSGRLAG